MPNVNNSTVTMHASALLCPRLVMLIWMAIKVSWHCDRTADCVLYSVLNVLYCMYTNSLTTTGTHVPYGITRSGWNQWQTYRDDKCIFTSEYFTLMEVITSVGVVPIDLCGNESLVACHCCVISAFELCSTAQCVHHTHTTHSLFTASPRLSTCISWHHELRTFLLDGAKY